VIAILGLLGGFLTPILLSTGQDNPGGLFGFIALLDLGLLAVVLHRSWFHLTPLAAIGTIGMQIGWASKFFVAPKAGIAVTVCLGFSVLFLAATEVATRLRRPGPQLIASAAALAVVSFGFAFFFLTYPSITYRPGLLLSFLFAADVILLALAWRHDGFAWLSSLAGGLSFAFLGVWTARYLTDDLLPWSLAACLLFAILHSAFPLLLQRMRPERKSGALSQLYAPLGLLLLLLPLLKSDEISTLFWPAVLLVDVIAVGIALATASVLALGVVLVLTLAAVALCIFNVPASSFDFDSVFWVISGFSLFFVGAGLFLSRRLGSRLSSESNSGTAPEFLANTAAQIPVYASLLPFVLLILASLRLEMPTPTPLFALGLLLSILVIGLSRILTIPWLPLSGLAGVAALEYAWHSRHFQTDFASVPLCWYLGFYALFALSPFGFRRHFQNATGPWAVAALSGVAHFPLIYNVVRRAWPNDFPGVLPVLFALAPLAGLFVILRSRAPDSPQRLNQLAWFGGTTLLFITLVFPIQFDREWITISWALEGIALLWLFHRIAHPGLRATGVVLLVIAFVRLTLNTEIFAYHVRSDTPIFNWYLYTYGVTLVSLFIGARLLAPPRERVLGINAPPLLNGLGVILTFLLMNIEIADYFSPAGTTLTFEFGENFARDLAYTVGWALFALSLLVVGIWKRAKAARYAALVLLGITMLKLFFHDLAQLGALYRVGALLIVAVVAIVASFLYQRFVPGDERTTPPPL
jgi:hypothetical protein